MHSQTALLMDTLSVQMSDHSIWPLQWKGIVLFLLIGGQSSVVAAYFREANQVSQIPFYSDSVSQHKNSAVKQQQFF